MFSVNSFTRLNNTSEFIMIYLMGSLLSGVPLWSRQVNELLCLLTDDVIGEVSEIHAVIVNI